MLPVHIESESNVREHWSVASKRHILQKKWVDLALSQHKLSFPCLIKLTRISPGILDVDDNLRTAFKYLKDYIAAQITKDFRPGRADSNPLLKWEYDQEKSSLYGAKVIILFERLAPVSNNQSALEV